jgi:hypothetical protein
MRTLVFVLPLLVAACGDDDSSTPTVDGSVSVDVMVGSVDAGPIPDASSPDASSPDAAPQMFYWADWSAATAGNPGSASGTLTTPAGTVNVTYEGEVLGAQTEGGTNYFVPGEPYINAVTANAPDRADIIQLVGGDGTRTLTFDPPVSGLVMAIVSLGAPGSPIKYDFDSAIELLSFGAGYWGDGPITVEGASGDIIAGEEGHGAIQFVGEVASVSWTVVGSESWHGFTLGIPAQ